MWHRDIAFKVHFLSLYFSQRSYSKSFVTSFRPATPGVVTCGLAGCTAKLWSETSGEQSAATPHWRRCCKMMTLWPDIFVCGDKTDKLIWSLCQMAHLGWQFLVKTPLNYWGPMLYWGNKKAEAEENLLWGVINFNLCWLVNTFLLLKGTEAGPLFW